MLGRKSILILAVLSAFLYMLLTSYTKEGEPSGGTVRKLISQVIEAIRPETNAFAFAGETLPLDNFDVRERLDRELTVNAYWHSSTLQHIKQAARYFPIIEKILAENGVPDDFKYLAVAESSLNNVSSPAGAKGIWQFMERTAESYGLEVNREIDERYHLEKATRAACEYLKEKYAAFGSWTLAAAAYNMGESGLREEMDAQQTNNYYDLNLNSETSRYVFRIVAIKEILSNPAKYGFVLEDQDLYPPLYDFKTIKVDTTIENLGVFARQQGTTYRMLKVYNPWMLSSRLPNSSRRTYVIRVPR